ncbi:MAG: GNAT family N-acetyltransferase [Desulfovibrionaceae bacterium]|nr:GNAT family N-acetyltransferase [Desulfovibrionaceae bacterium]
MPASPWTVNNRLRLREFAAHDAQHIIDMHAQPRVRAQLVDDYPLDEPACAQRFIAGIQALYRRHEGAGIWCAERAMPPDPQDVAQARAARAAGEISPAPLAFVSAPAWRFIGWFSLMYVMNDPSRLEIGARLLPEAWGGSIALDGCEWLLTRAFEHPGRDCVFGHCAPANRSAAHCLRVLGFAPTGLAPYEGGQAAQFLLRREHWNTWRDLPRRTRQRRALEAR